MKSLVNSLLEELAGLGKHIVEPYEEFALHYPYDEEKLIVLEEDIGIEDIDTPIDVKEEQRIGKKFAGIIKERLNGISGKVKLKSAPTPQVYPYYNATYIDSNIIIKAIDVAFVMPRRCIRKYMVIFEIIKEAEEN